ncbi:MAG TPA: hypothetical protein VII52_09075, partial [Gemmatimonadaceae bacterium]
MWRPSASVVDAARRDTSGAELSATVSRQLTLPAVVDLALRNSPLTRQSWTQARAAADIYGSTEGRLYPTLTAGVGVNQALTLSTPGRAPVQRAQFGPSLSLGYTVLDFGGRAGTIDVARQTAIA